MLFSRIRSWVLALAVCVPVLVAPAVGTANAAADDHQVAVTCYGGSVPITLPPNGYGGVYTTTSRCTTFYFVTTGGGGNRSGRAAF